MVNTEHKLIHSLTWALLRSTTHCVYISVCVFFRSVEAFQTTHSCHARLDAIQCDDEHQNGNICGVEHVSEWREPGSHRMIIFFSLSLSSFQFSKMFIWIVSRVALNERRYSSIWSLFMASSTTHTSRLSHTHLESSNGGSLSIAVVMVQKSNDPLLTLLMYDVFTVEIYVFFQSFSFRVDSVYSIFSIIAFSPSLISIWYNSMASRSIWNVCMPLRWSTKKQKSEANKYDAPNSNWKWLTGHKSEGGKRARGRGKGKMLLFSLFK